MTLEKDLDESTREELAKLGPRVVALLQGFHDLLGNPSMVAGYLSQLEGIVAPMVAGGNTPMKALTLALAGEEHKWMPNPPNPAAPKEEKNYDRVNISEGEVTGPALVKSHLSKRAALKDVGAALSHGEWAHRIQLFVFSRWVDGLSPSEAPDPKALKQKLYDALLVLDPSTLLAKEATPVWSFVMDVPLGMTTGDNPKLSPVAAAAPAWVTGAITKVGTPAGAGPIGTLPNLQVALLDRRIKRFFEARQQIGAIAADYRQKFPGVPVPAGKKNWSEVVKGTMEEGRANEIQGWLDRAGYFVWTDRSDLALSRELKALVESPKATFLLGSSLPVLLKMALKSPPDPFVKLAKADKARITTALVTFMADRGPLLLLTQ